MHNVHERALEGETLKFALEHAHLKGIIECVNYRFLLNKYFI